MVRRCGGRCRRLKELGPGVHRNFMSLTARATDVYPHKSRKSEAAAYKHDSPSPISPEASHLPGPQCDHHCHDPAPAADEQSATAQKRGTTSTSRRRHRPGCEYGQRCSPGNCDRAEAKRRRQIGTGCAVGQSDRRFHTEDSLRSACSGSNRSRRTKHSAPGGRTASSSDELQ